MSCLSGSTLFSNVNFLFLAFNAFIPKPVQHALRLNSLVPETKIAELANSVDLDEVAN